MKAELERKLLTATGFAEMASFWLRPWEEVKEGLDDDEMMAERAVEDIRKLMNHIVLVENAR